MLHNTLAGTDIVMTMSITVMQFFTEILSTSKVTKFNLSAGSDKNHAGDSTWWSTKLEDFHFTER